MQTENNPIIKLEIDEAGISDFCENEDFSAQTIEVEILPPVDINDQREIEIYNGIDEIDEKLSVISARVDELNSELDCLTNHADGIDYTIAVASGVITGLIDAFLIGEFDFKGSRETVDKKFKELVKKKAIAIEEGEKEQRINKAIKEYKEKAAKEGKPISDEKIEKIKKSINESYEKKHDVDAQLQKAIEKAKAKNEPIDIEKLRKKVEDNELSKAIAKLEEVFGLPSDSSYGAGDGISAKSHHLDDLAHHPTIIGWAASMVTQFTGNAYFQNKEGKNLKYKVKKVRVIDNVNAYIIYGNSIETTRITAKGNEKPALEVTLIGDDLKSKFACGTFNWLGHLLSDMAGSSSSAKKGNPGMGLPGPIMSLRHNLEQRNSKINNDISLCEEKADKQISDLKEDVRQAFVDYEEKHKLFSEQVQNVISQLKDELDMQNAESHSKVEELERKITSLETEISKKAWKIAVSVIASASLLLNFLQLLGVI